METSVEELGQKMKPILKRHGVVHAAIYGSFTKQVPEDDSDIDVLVEFEGKVSLLDLAAIRLDLTEALGRYVDVVTYRSLHPRIREHVLNEQVAIL